MDCVDVVIVGAGVIGLAIASELASKDREMYVLEKEMKYGQATSSRNSEVIHAGIYYEYGSLKQELCVKANPKLYEICEQNGISHKRVGKIIVANSDDEIQQLEKIIVKARQNGVKDLEIIDAARIHELEPYVQAEMAILSPSTGIVDAHGLMDHFYQQARHKSSIDPVVLNTKVIGIRQVDDGYIVRVISSGDPFNVFSRIVINSAGLYCDRVAEMVGIDVDEAGYKLYWCKGDYFSLKGKPLTKMLVYPPPPLDEVSLGIHSIPDLTGRIRFGPNSYYVDKITNTIESDKEEFWRDIIRYFPSVKLEDLSPDISGIRAKIQAPGTTAKDFVIRHEDDRGLPGFINLVGIESPGLTCSPAIADIVARIVDKYLG